MKKFMRRLTALLAVLAFLLVPVAPALAQLGAGVDTSGTSVPAPTPAEPTPPPSAPEPTPTVITTSIPAEPPPPTTTETTTTVTETTPSNPITPVVTEVLTPPADTTAPAIVDVSSLSLEPHTATIIWTTDEIATSQLEYGTTPSYGSVVTLAVTASFAHDATMLNLTSNTTYYYCIHATDLAGNVSSSCGHSVTTAAAEIVIDTMPPTISIETVSLITAGSASVTWATDKLAEGYVEYGTTDAYGAQTPLETDFTPSHTASVTGLSANTTYHYRIHSRDTSSNVLVTPDNTFTTNPVVGTIPEPTTTVPEGSPITGTSVTVTVPETTTVSVGPITATVPAVIISGVAADSISETGATITWTTDLPSDSRVAYGDASQFNETGESASLTTSHSAMLTDLYPDTTYEFRVSSAPVGAGAVETVSSVHDFITLARPIVLNPAANILTVSSSNVTGSGASASFTTDEVTHGSVEYGLTTAYGETSAGTALQSSHTLSISPLLSGTTYHFRVKAVDAADNITYSIDHTFTTIGVSIESENSAVSPTTPEVTVSTGTNSLSSSEGVAAPAIVTVAPVDTEVVFIVNPQATVGDATVIVVRGDGNYPTSPTDGEVVYDGNGDTFTDTDLTNGSTYNYTVYTRSSGGGYSSPVRIAATPKAGIEQVQLDRNPVLEPGMAAQHFAADISVGTKSEEVLHLQQILNTESVHPTALTTGYFGSLTLASLKRLQGKYSLAQTGVVDAPTRKVLNSLSQGWMVLGAPTAMSELTDDLKLGDSGQDVGDLQEFLAYEGSYEEGIISNYFGPLTKASVVDFQKKFGVTPVSGYVGPKTRHTILTVLGQ